MMSDGILVLAENQTKTPRIRAWLVALLAITAVKLIWLWIDPAPRFYMGDSESYLYDAVSKEYVVNDRSVLYGELLRVIAVYSRSLFAMVVAQTLLGVASAMLVWYVIRRFSSLSNKGTVGLAALFAIAPEQVFLERMIMAEAFGMLGFLGFLLMALCYAETGKFRYLLGVVLAGLAWIAFRINAFPVVLVVSAALPLLRWLDRDRRGRGNGLKLATLALVQLAIILVITGISHHQYKRWFAWHSQTAVYDYTARVGAFRLGIVAPLVKPEHLVDLQLPVDFLDQVKVPLADRRMREGQVWSDVGLVGTLMRYSKDSEQAARKISMRALRDQKLAFVLMQLRTVGDFWDPPFAHDRIVTDAGNRPFQDKADQWLLQSFADIDMQFYKKLSVSAQYFVHARVWFALCFTVLLPLAIGCWLHRRWRSKRWDAVLGALACLACCSQGVVMLATTAPVFRYLHTLPVLLMLLIVLHQFPRAGCASSK
jgi:hypothetical protein